MANITKEITKEKEGIKLTNYLNDYFQYFVLFGMKTGLQSFKK